MNEPPQGRSIEELTTPRPVMMPPPDIFDQHLAEMEGSLRSSVPEVIRERIRTSRNLLVYGAYCKEFVGVSILWSLTCIEMALWEKFTEMKPGPLTVARKGIEETIMAKHLLSRLHAGYRVVGMPTFNGSFRSLVNWGAEKGVVAGPGVLDSMVEMRNSFAHPKEFNSILVPGMAVTIFQRTIEVVNHLWPLEVGG